MILKNYNVLVTGAGKGIGFETVKNLIKNGAFVYALVRKKEDFKKFNSLNKKQFIIFAGDVRDKNIFNQILRLSIKKKQYINGLINNAGIRFRKKFSDISPNELLKVFDNNFFSIFYICQKYSDYVRKHNIHASIVNISSIVGNLGFNELSVYASSKGALNALTKSLAVELSNLKIRVNSINPGFTKSSYFNKFKRKKKLYNWTISRIPLKRWGEVEEISELISFLVSKKSSYINGECINIDGGWSAA